MKMNFRDRKKSIVALAVGIVFAAMLGTTLAVYYDITAEVKNTFTSGEVKTNLVEPFYQEDNNNFVKKPQVVNSGKSACLVRARYEISPSDVADRLSITGQGAKWIHNETDGWYYYEGILEVGETSEPLFAHVAYTGTDEEWQDFDIQVYQESVQPAITYNGERITDAEQIWALYDAGALDG